MRVRVSTGGRLHFGFCNLSLAHERLYGGVGVALDEPRTRVRAAPASAVSCDDADAAAYARLAVEQLGVEGADLVVEEALPRHAGLGSGTQLALAVYAAVARAHGVEPTVRQAAPALDRGGRSGVGVATFEAGGFVVDGGHPTERFTADRPPAGGWTVPPVVARHAVPDEWRFVVAVPAVEPGLSGDEEDRRIRAAIEEAAPGITDEIAAIVVRRLLPAVATGDAVAFGRAVAELGRLNGVWYADQQGGVYRPPVGAVVDELAACPAVYGAGQSSWGPAVYGVTDVDGADEALGAARTALDEAGVDGDVLVTAARTEGARVETG